MSSEPRSVDDVPPDELVAVGDANQSQTEVFHRLDPDSDEVRAACGNLNTDSPVYVVERREAEERWARVDHGCLFCWPAENKRGTTGDRTEPCPICGIETNHLGSHLRYGNCEGVGQ